MPGNHNINPEVFFHYSFNVKSIKPFRKAFQIQTDGGIYALKKTSLPEEKLLFIYSAVKHLKERGFNKLAPILPTKDGKPYAKVEGETYVLSKWVNGQEADYHNIDHIKSAVKTIAEFHFASKGFKPCRGSKINSDLGKWPEKFAKRCRLLLDLKMDVLDMEPCPFTGLFLREIDYYLNEGARAIALLAGSGYFHRVEKEALWKSFIHHDLVFHNVIIDNNGVAHLIDFDFCVYDLRSHDIASLIQKACKRHHWDINIAHLILDNYHVISPLKQNELKLILARIIFPQDFLEYSIRFVEAEDVKEERRAYKGLKDFIDMKTDRENFIKKFEKIFLN